MLVWFKLEKLMRCRIFALKALLFPTINFGLKKKRQLEVQISILAFLLTQHNTTCFIQIAHML